MQTAPVPQRSDTVRFPNTITIHDTVTVRDTVFAIQARDPNWSDPDVLLGWFGLIATLALLWLTRKSTNAAVAGVQQTAKALEDQKQATERSLVIAEEANRITRERAALDTTLATFPIILCSAERVSSSVATLILSNIGDNPALDVECFLIEERDMLDQKTGKFDHELRIVFRHLIATFPNRNKLEVGFEFIRGGADYVVLLQFRNLLGQNFIRLFDLYQTVRDRSLPEDQLAQNQIQPAQEDVFRIAKITPHEVKVCNRLIVSPSIRFDGNGDAPDFLPNELLYLLAGSQSELANLQKPTALLSHL